MLLSCKGRIDRSWETVLVVYAGQTAYKLHGRVNRHLLLLPWPASAQTAPRQPAPLAARLISTASHYLDFVHGRLACSRCDFLTSPLSVSWDASIASLLCNVPQHPSIYSICQASPWQPLPIKRY